MLQLPVLLSYVCAFDVYFCRCVGMMVLMREFSVLLCGQTTVVDFLA